MYSKFIIVLATLCVANASVVVNFFDDDPNIGVLSKEKDCNPTACDQLCRRLKFPGGACVNGRCKCDNFFSENEGVSELSPSDFEAFSTLEDEPLSEDEAGDRSRCRPSACEIICHSLQHPGGACVNGRCQCDKLFEKQDELENEISYKDCNPTACDQLCRRLKFPGGACVNGRCKCDIFRSSEEAVLELSPSDLEAFSTLEDEHLSEAEVADRSSCSLSACEQHCHRLKLPGGACVNGRCKCDKFFSEQGLVDANSAPVEEPAKNVTHGKCKPGLCDLICRKLKYDRGECLENKCKCFKNEGLVQMNSAPVLEPAKNNTHGKCRQGLCDLICRKLKYHRGECVDNQCKCYKDEVERDDNDTPITQFSEDLKKVVCTKRVCNRMCRSLEYEGGNCKNGKCWCYGPPKKSARSVLENTTEKEKVISLDAATEKVSQIKSDEEKEESKEDTYGKDKVISRFRRESCSPSMCEDRCGFIDARGFCFLGICFCY
uniref:X-tox n=1 Tax=Spodoptera exigua TaxID=7107 RepID=A0A0G3DN07_SPOEX|nr:x-tox [Spodoptera exigua]